MAEVSPGSPPNRRGFIDLIMGLDFGTSCTKVVIRTPFSAGHRAVAVPFSSSGSMEDYLLPSKVSIDEHHVLHAAAQPGGRAVWDIKERVRRDVANRTAQAAIAGYLSHVIRESRRWYLVTQAGVLAGLVPRWSLNLGIPSAGYDDSPTRAAFQAAAKAGWLLADRPLVTLDDCLEALEAVEGRELDAHVEVVPEVAAEVVGIARSDWRQEGLYFMVDVGASTLDVCGFRLHSKDHDDEYALFSASVTVRGAARLHQYRLHELRRRNLEVESDLRSPEQGFHGGVPGSCCDYVVDWSSRRAAHEIDRTFLAECAKEIRGVVVAVKRLRDPNAPEWKKGVPVFVGGGGGLVGLYPEAVQEADRVLRKAFLTAGLRQQELPVPGDLDPPLPKPLFRRLAVAYGLSYHSFEIGNIIPPSGIEDVEPPPVKNWTGAFITKEMT